MSIDEEFARLESAIRDLAARVAAVEERLGALQASERAEGPASAEPLVAAGEPGIPRADSVAVLSLIGRTFIVLGGAYLLRASTESGRLPVAIGVGLGVVYALGWLAAADLASRRGRTLDASLHGIASALIAFPLVAESTLRFHLLAPPASAAALGALAGASLLVAWRRRHRLLAWIVTVASGGAAVGLLGTTNEPLPYTVFLIALGVITLWLAYDRDWVGLRWPTAVAADVCVVGLTARAIATPPREAPAAVIAVQVGLVGIYLASIAARTLVRGRNVVPFEIVQSALVLLAGLGGAIAVARSAAAGGTALGLSCLLLAAGSYAVAFAFVDRRQGRGRNFYFYSFLAVVFALGGTQLTLGGDALAIAWAALGAAAAWLGARTARLALFLQGAIYLVGAGIVSGLYRGAWEAFVAGMAAGAPGPGAAGMAVVAAAALACAAPRLRTDEGWKGLVHVPRVIVLLTLVAGAGSALVHAGVGLLSGPGGAAVHPGIVATIRSVVLGAAALILALLARWARFDVSRWIVYPVLAAAALKLAVEDLRVSAASGLFVALAVYGAALILAPRLLRSAARRGGAGETAAAPPSG